MQLFYNETITLLVNKQLQIFLLNQMSNYNFFSNYLHMKRNKLFMQPTINIKYILKRVLVKTVELMRGLEYVQTNKTKTKNQTINKQKKNETVFFHRYQL